MCLIRWSAAIRIRRSSSQKTVSEGLWPGPVQHLQRAVAQLERARRRAAAGSPSPSRPRRETPRTPSAARCTIVLGDAVAQHHAAPRTRRRARRPRAKCSAKCASLSIAATSAPEWPTMMSTSPRWSMCWWVSTTSSMSSIEWPCSASWCCSSSSARPEFGPGVDQRQRVVLDQVGVDAPDRERRRDPQQVDARLGGARERLLGARVGRSAHERISRSTSSVRASISSLRRTPRGSGAGAARCSTAAR